MTATCTVQRCRAPVRASFAAGVGRCLEDPVRLASFCLGLLAAMDREHTGVAQRRKMRTHTSVSGREKRRNRRVEYKERYLASLLEEEERYNKETILTK